MIQTRKKRSLEKHKGQAMEKIALQRQEKKLKRPHGLNKRQNHLNLLTQARKKKKDHPRTIKGKKYLLYWDERRSPKFFESSEGW